MAGAGLSEAKEAPGFRASALQLRPPENQVLTEHYHVRVERRVYVERVGAEPETMRRHRLGGARRLLCCGPERVDLFQRPFHEDLTAFGADFVAFGNGTVAAALHRAR